MACARRYRVRCARGRSTGTEFSEGAAMPTFDVDLNGTPYEIEAPDLATAAAAIKAQLGASSPPPEQPSPGVGGTVADILKSGGVGLGQGIIGLAGLPGVAAQLGTRASDYLFGT